MINASTAVNISKKNKQAESADKVMPFLLEPAYKNYLWGGTRLAKEFGKSCEGVPLAETWECSTHPDGVSVVASGVYKGMPLDKMIQLHPEILGTHPVKLNGSEELPILVKLIDAGENASIQVHPDDEYAHIHENGENGKAEMWYVLDAGEDAKLIYGFYQDMNETQVRRALEENDIERYMHKIKVQKDDVFYVEPGRVHGIGAGILLAEIQQNSNITYRLYDYNRKDEKGCSRELHIDKALEVAGLKGSAEPRQPMRVLRYKPGCATELLCRCKYFQTERMLINTTDQVQGCVINVIKESFYVLLCLEGEGLLYKDEPIMIKKGSCIFVPAGTYNIQIKGKMQLLQIRC